LEKSFGFLSDHVEFGLLALLLAPVVLFLGDLLACFHVIECLLDWSLSHSNGG
jgi:hypothetical protein